MIPQEAIERIKEAVDMQTLAAEYVTLRKSGPGHVAVCPFHDEKTPSLRVYSDHFHCFGCQASGSAIDWVMRLEDASFPEATRILAERVGMSLNHKPVSRIQSTYARDEAEYCRWWWAARETGLMDLIYDELASDELSAAESLSSVRRWASTLKPAEKYSLFIAQRTDTDRKRWVESRQELEQKASEFRRFAGWYFVTRWPELLTAP